MEKGKKLLAYIDGVNDKYDTNIKIGQVLNKGTIKKLAPEGYLILNNGTRRLQLSYHKLILGTVIKLAKKRQKSKTKLSFNIDYKHPIKTKKSIWTVKNK